MKFLNSKTLVAGILGVVALVGCGGGSSGQAPTAATAEPARSIAATGVVQYVAEMRTNNSSDATEPRDISKVDMATDDAAEPGEV